MYFRAWPVMCDWVSICFHSFFSRFWYFSCFIWTLIWMVAMWNAKRKSFLSVLAWRYGVKLCMTFSKHVLYITHTVSKGSPRRSKVWFFFFDVQILSRGMQRMKSAQHIYFFSKTLLFRWFFEWHLKLNSGQKSESRGEIVLEWNFHFNAYSFLIGFLLARSYCAKFY